MKIGYFRAIELATERLAGLDPVAVCARTGAAFADGRYMLPFLGKQRELSSGSEGERVLWLHYLTSEGTRRPTGRLIAYREAPGAAFYMPAFEKRAVHPLVKRFGDQPGKLIEAGRSLGGEQTQSGDAAVTLYLLPNVPVTYIIWAGDDELPPEGAVLFDETAPGWMPTEDLAVLASQGTYALIKS